MNTRLLVKKGYLRRKVYSYGVNGKHSHMMRYPFKTLLTVGLTGLPCMLFLMTSLARQILIQTDRCALIHCHRPDLLDYNSLDKVH